MFQKYKNIDAGFRQMRMVSILVVVASIAISIFSVYSGFNHAMKAEGRVYILAGGAAMEAVAAGRKENIPVELKDHLRNFHQLFFTLEPDEKVIEANMGRALYLADGSAKRLYDNLKEAGFFTNIISGNVSQSVKVDSIWLDMGPYPFHFKCWGTEKLLRATTVTTRSLITTGWIRNTARSDNNAHGFLIEKFEVLDNRDLIIQNR